jgi:DNA primase catalytic subunit
MLIWVQKTDNATEQWIPLEIDPAKVTPEELGKEYRHSTVYSYAGDKGQPYETYRLQGDLAMDIDAKDLNLAISWANKLLDLLEKWEVDLNQIGIYCSGSKGFHVVVPQKIFGDGQPVQSLNKLHGYMAAVIENEAGIVLDRNLYKTRAMLRIANTDHQKEGKKGRWKVQVSADEVRRMTVEDYLQYVTGPRSINVIGFTTKAHNVELGKLWKKAKDAVKAAQKVQHSPVPDEDLDEFGDGRFPECIRAMLDPNKIKKTGLQGRFNAVSMQVGAFLGHAQNITGKGRDDYIKQLVHAYESGNHPTPELREKHVRGNVSLAEKGNLDFSCGGCKSVLEHNPCAGCPVQEKQRAAAEQSTSIVDDEEGYLYKNHKGEGMRIATFTLTRERQICSIGDGGIHLHADHVSVNVKNKSGVVESTQVHIPAEDWVSLASLSKKVASVRGAMFLTSNDAMLTALRLYLQQTQDPEVIMKSDKIGIHVTRSTDGKEPKVWVENGWSVDDAGITSKIMYEGDAGDTCVSLCGIPRAKPEDTEVVEYLDRLMHSNVDVSVGHLLGWASACHLKEHLNAIQMPEFPLLHIAGQKGAGKTHTATVYSALTGTRLVNGPMVVGLATPLPIKKALSESTTVARVFDEFNKPQMEFNRYTKILECFKAAYVRQGISTGYIGKKSIGGVNTAVDRQAATAPCIYLSKEATASEELLQRSIVIKIDEKAHETDNNRENFQWVYRETLDKAKVDGNASERLVKAMVDYALKMDLETCRQWHKEAQADLPNNEHSRRVQNLFVIRTGLRFLRAVLEGFPQPLLDRLAELDRIVVDSWHTEKKSIEEMRLKMGTPETVLEHLDHMAEILPETNTPGRLSPGHYVRDGNTLYLNAVTCFQQYHLYTRSMQIPNEVGSPQALIELYRTANYCLGQIGPPGNANARGWIALDLSQLEHITTGGFVEE